MKLFFFWVHIFVAIMPCISVAFFAQLEKEYKKIDNIFKTKPPDYGRIEKAYKFTKKLIWLKQENIQHKGDIYRIELDIFLK